MSFGLGLNLGLGLRTGGGGTASDNLKTRLNGQADLEGTLQGIPRNLAGSLTGSANLTGDVSVIKELAGSFTGTADLVGDLTVEITNNEWTPADLGSSLSLWLDADDANTITLNGSTVSQWDDKSGNANHVSNATASTQPDYLATGWNGQPTVSFTKSGLEFLFKQNVANFSASGDFTIASAFEFLETTNNWDMIAGWRSTANTASGAGAPILQGMRTNQEIGFHNTDKVDTRIKVNVTTRLGKKIATISRSGGTAGNNGAATVTSTGFSQTTYQTDATQTWGSDPATGFQIGGRQQGATDYGDKYISEVVCCNTKLSTIDRQKLEGYLAWKWGLEADLPADHPHELSLSFSVLFCRFALQQAQQVNTFLSFDVIVSILSY